MRINNLIASCLTTFVNLSYVEESMWMDMHKERDGEGGGAQKEREREREGGGADRQTDRHFIELKQIQQFDIK